MSKVLGRPARRGFGIIGAGDGHGVEGDSGEDRGMSVVETDIGTIDPDWKVVPLKDVAEKPQYGLTAKAAKSGDTQFLRITDITDQGVNWATVPFCSAPKKENRHVPTQIWRHRLRSNWSNDREKLHDH